jgi:hypothetical protein
VSPESTFGASAAKAGTESSRRANITDKYIEFFNLIFIFLLITP